jgi:hypothetical protein
MSSYIIDDFEVKGGKHCQTTALRHVLLSKGIKIDEETLFGLGGGLGFIYWHVKVMPVPFIGGRTGGKNELFLRNACERIGTRYELFQTESPKKAYDKLIGILSNGSAVYTFVDMAYLPYLALPNDAHFGGHTVAVFGVDEEKNLAYVADRSKKAFEVNLNNLRDARNSKYAPFPAMNKLLDIEYPQDIEITNEAIIYAIKECCNNMRNPPIKNIGLEGMKKWAQAVQKWPDFFKGMNLFGCIFNTFIYLEIGGTGGGAFRPMYSRFLDKASKIINLPLNESRDDFEELGKLWSHIAYSALPNWWPVMKDIRELLIKKNRIFEEGTNYSLDDAMEYNKTMEVMIENACEEMKSKDFGSLLSDLKDNILICYEKEKEAFEKLNNIIENI